MPRRNRKTMVHGFPRRRVRTTKYLSKRTILRLERWEKYLRAKYVQKEQLTGGQNVQAA